MRWLKHSQREQMKRWLEDPQSQFVVRRPAIVEQQITCWVTITAAGNLALGIVVVGQPFTGCRTTAEGSRTRLATLAAIADTRPSLVNSDTSAAATGNLAFVVIAAATNIASAVVH